MQNGVSFVVKYIGELPNDAIPKANKLMVKISQGCIEIITSMKLLDFQSRSLVAKECINRVCDAASLKSPKKRRVEKRIQSCIADEHCLEHSGASVGTYGSDFLFEKCLHQLCSQFSIYPRVASNSLLSKLER